MDATRIAQVFQSGIRRCMLFAEVQEGKTGRYLETIAQLLDRGLIQDVWIITGASESQLKRQLQASVDDAIHYQTIDEICATLDENGDPQVTLSKVVRAGKLKKLQDAFKRIRVLFSQDLKNHTMTTQERSNKKLIIWEEAHVAEQTRNLPAKWLHHHQCMPLIHDHSHELDPDDEMLQQTLILTVSATPSAELYNAHDRRIISEDGASSDASHSDESDESESDSIDMPCFQGPGRVIKATRSTDYTGMKEFLEAGVFEECKPVTTPEGEACLRRNLQLIQERRLYAVIRCASSKTKGGKKKLDAICTIATQLGLPVKYYRSQGTTFEIEQFEERPSTTTIVIVDSYLRMGHVLPKTWQGLAMETADSSTGTTSVQGLPGRLSGYWPDDRWKEQIRILVSDLSEIRRYADNSFNTLSSSTVTLKMAPRTRSQRVKYRPAVPIHIRSAQLNTYSEHEHEHEHEHEEDGSNSLGDVVKGMISRGQSAVRTEIPAVSQHIANIVREHGAEFLQWQRADQREMVEKIFQEYEFSEESKPQIRTIVPGENYKVEFEKLQRSSGNPDVYFIRSNWYHPPCTHGGSPSFSPFQVSVVMTDSDQGDLDLQGNPFCTGDIIITCATHIGETFNPADLPHSPKYVDADAQGEIWNPHNVGQIPLLKESSSYKRTRDASGMNDDEHMNGQQFGLSPDTRINVTQMKTELEDAVTRFKTSSIGAGELVHNIICNKAAFQHTNGSRAPQRFRRICHEIEHEHGVTFELLKKAGDIRPDYKTATAARKRKITRQLQGGETLADIVDKHTEWHLLALRIRQTT